MGIGKVPYAGHASYNLERARSPIKTEVVKPASRVRTKRWQLFDYIVAHPGCSLEEICVKFNIKRSAAHQLIWNLRNTDGREIKLGYVVIEATK